MVRGTSLFSQVLSLIGRVEFAKHVKELKAERGSKGFSCWGQFVGMMFCQMAQAQSLREICDGLRCCLGKLNHLGLRRRRVVRPYPTPTPSGRGSCSNSRSTTCWRARNWRRRRNCVLRISS